MALGMEAGLGPGDFVLDGDPDSPPQKGGGEPNFFAHVSCGQTAGWIMMVLGMEVGLGPSDVVLDGGPAAPKKGAEPQKFSAHVYCGQTARWIKIALGMEAGLGPGDFVLDGDPDSPPQKGGRQQPRAWSRSSAEVTSEKWRNVN